MLAFQKTRHATLAVASVFLCAAGTVHAQAHLDILGNEVRLGAERRVVVEQLRSFRLKCLEAWDATPSTCQSMVVQTNAPPFDVHANIVFEGSRVRSIRKYWSRGYADSDPAPFVKTLFDVVSALTRESKGPVSVVTTERRDPGALALALHFYDGRKKISVSYNSGLRDVDGKEMRPFVNLDEVLE